MRKLLLLVIVLQSFFAFGQKISNNLVGKYKNKSFWSFVYTSLEFDGKGTAIVDGKEYYDYFEKDNTVYVLAGGGGLIFEKVNGNELKGISKKVRKSTFIAHDDEFKYGPKTPGSEKRLELLDKFYNWNYVETDALFERKGEGNFMASMKTVKQGNQKLCDAGLDTACIQVFIYGLGEKAIGVVSVLSDDSVKKVEHPKADPELEKLGYKIIDMGNNEGYGLLYSYYTIIDQEKKGIELNEKGLKKGCRLCASNKEIYEKEL
ncbi:hypothetical protein [Myroides odoratimimus]|uniref:hypothetical protein n=1 Tax=Myroides odoratimimus TaxID=76832 RepID=UPI0031017005